MAKFKVDRNRSKEDIELSKSVNNEIIDFKKENEILIEKLNGIDDYYQAEIKKLVDRIEAEHLREVQKLKDEILELKSRALVNPRKVTDEQVIKIKELRASGLSYRAIVKETGLSTCTIQRALNGIYD